MFTPAKHPYNRANKATTKSVPFFGSDVSTPFFQAKLTVNQPGDAHEQEADRVADQVMRMREGDAPIVQRMPLTPVSGIMRACAECEKEKMQRKETGGGDASGKAAPSIVSDVLSSSSGQPMEGGTRQFMESRFGHDFSQVRIHTDSQAAESASAIQARAYTSGRDVVFGTGEYQPGSEGGKRLLAHELAHVKQQGGMQSNWVLKADETSEASENDCRKKTRIRCPGTRDNAKRLGHAGSMSVTNMGNCTLFLHGIDASGTLINFPYLEIFPGETKTFTPSKEAVDVVVACHSGCEGRGVLSHPSFCGIV